ncbi:MAG: ATP-binding protein [Cyanobacteria bacterium J06649_4]
MQTSQHLVTNQIVSLSVYERLRDCLMHQADLFDSVETELQGIISQNSQDSQVSGSHSGVRFVLMRSRTFNVLLAATPAEGRPSPHYGHREHGTEYERVGHQSAVNVGLTMAEATASEEGRYRLQLTFDDDAIADFVHQLPSNRPLQHQLSDTQLFEGQLLEEQPSAARPSRATNRITQQNGGQPTVDKEAFVLSWVKQLASSPEGDSQPTQDALDEQIQQSLLLNQVITRIRHSLDLPSILETTVAQVREFLSADRLVLYQFDQLDSVDLSYLLENEGEEDGATEQSNDFDSGNFDNDNSDNGSAAEKRRANSTTTADLSNGMNPAGGTIIGRCIHEGHVTYESRISEDIPSVLNFSEEACFHPQWSIRNRFILGQPVAIDDIETQYADVECLRDFLRKAQIKSKIIAPIIVQDQLWGLLIAHQCYRQRCWKETEGIFLQHIAEHLAVAISQAALYHQLRQQTASLESCVIERTQNLHDALMAAESANLTKGEFLSTMSHELRTPLTYIIGMSATLLRWSFGELSARQRNYLTTINHSGEQLLTIINDILEFAKIEAGRSLLDFSEFSLSESVNNVVSHYQPLAEKQEVSLSLSFSVAAEKDRFTADFKRLQQILSNLVHNAIKFTPAEGSVSVQVWREAQTCVFQVTDSGIGIPESQRDLLFEKFKQLESPFQRQYSGTGLGLAMTKRLVELHGGSIHVESVVGSGSSFTVRLPVREATMAEGRYQVPRTIGANTKRVLLVEVEEDSAGIICDLLTADGYEVIWLGEADQLLPQLSSLQPALLIADLSLLSHNLDDIKAIQLSITAMGAKVLALLGQPASQSSHIAHHDTLNKPIDPKMLLEKTRQLTLHS